MVITSYRATALFLPTLTTKHSEVAHSIRRYPIPGRFIKMRFITLRKAWRTHARFGATTAGLFSARQPRRCSPLPTSRVCMVTSRSIPRTARVIVLPPDAAAACSYSDLELDHTDVYLNDTEHLREQSR